MCKGRLGRRFESPAGKGVYCSVLLRPEMPAANAQTATISAAVAVCRAVKKLCGLELAIKWVNDLYYQGRKVCGILTEAGTDLESGQLEWLEQLCGAVGAFQRVVQLFNTRERRQFLQKTKNFSNFFFFHRYGTIAV